jgi:hypothetical protein
VSGLVAWGFELTGLAFRQVRTFDNVDLGALTYRWLDGVNKVSPAVDLSGQRHGEENPEE